MVGGEVIGMVIFGGHHGRGGRPAPTEILRRPAEFSPQGVGFLQHITPGIGPVFQPVEDELRGAFLPALFKGGTSQIPRREVTGMPVKQAGVFFPDTTQTAGANWTASSVFTGHLVVAIR